VFEPFVSTSVDHPSNAYIMFKMKWRGRATETRVFAGSLNQKTRQLEGNTWVDGLPGGLTYWNSGNDAKGLTAKF